MTLLPMSGPFDIRAVPRLIHLVDSHKISIIHTHDHKSHVLGRLVKFFRGVTVISTLHGLISDAKEIPQPRRSLYGLLVAITNPLTDHWIAVSRPLYERFKGNRSNVSLIRNAVDAIMVEPDGSEQLPPDSGPVILCLGRLSHEKGQDILLDAFSLVVGQVPDAVLWLAGEGSG